MNVPCLTLRDNTERLITVTQGTNELVSMGGIEDWMETILMRDWKQAKGPELWDGRTAERVVDFLRARET